MNKKRRVFGVLTAIVLLILLVGCVTKPNREETLKKVSQEFNNLNLLSFQENENKDNVLTTIDLQVKYQEYDITYQSSSATLLVSGDVATAVRGDQDKAVKLTATLKFDDQSVINRDFYLVIVKKEVATDLLANILVPATTFENITLPNSVDGHIITWASNNEAVLTSGGVVTRQSEDVAVVLTATVTVNGKEQQKHFAIIVKGQNAVIFDFNPIIAKIVIPTETDVDLNLPTLIDGVSITWMSNNQSVLSNTGKVTRQNENVEVVLQAELKKDSDRKVITFTVMVNKKNDNPIDYQEILNQITIPTTTSSNLTLPTTISGVSITWSSNNQAITNTGSVTQSSADVAVTLTATAGDVSKTFTVTVLKKVGGVISTKTPIAEVREMAQGVTVEIHGVNTSLMSNGNYTIEDSTGAIPVYFGPKQNSMLDVGKEYIISGTLGEFQGLLQLSNPTIVKTVGTAELPTPIDLTGYSLNFDDVTNYEAYVITYKNLEVTQVLTPNDALELVVKNEAGEETSARLDKRVNDEPYGFSGLEVGKIIDLYNVTIGQYAGKAQFMFTRRSSIESRLKNPDLVSIYGVKNIVFEIGDATPNYLEGITAKNGHGVDFTSDLEVDASGVNLTATGTYTVYVTLRNNSTVKDSYTVTVREPFEPGDYSGYYQSINGLTGTQLTNQLENLIRNTGTNTGSTSQVQQVDRWGGSYYLIYTGLGSYGNREHTWPKSLLGTVKDDLHNLRAANSGVNSSRSNYPFTENNRPFTGSEPYQKIGSAWYPGDEHIGDVARIVFYQSIRYNLSLNRVGNLNLFLKWHALDPVNEFELSRNDRIYNIQNNRNPFIDHPELVEAYYGAPTASREVTQTLLEVAIEMNSHPFILTNSSIKVEEVNKGYRNLTN